MLSLFCGKAMRKRGFTLVEIMIVVAVIGILAAVLIPGAIKMKDEAKSAGVDTNIRTMMAAGENYIESESTTAGISAKLVAKANGVLKNPVTTTTGAITITTATTAGLTSCTPDIYSFVVYNPATPLADEDAAYNAINPTTLTALKGCVIAVPWGTNATTLKGVTYFAVNSDGQNATGLEKAKTFTVKK